MVNRDELSDNRLIIIRNIGSEALSIDYLPDNCEDSFSEIISQNPLSAGSLHIWTWDPGKNTPCNKNFFRRWFHPLRRRLIARYLNINPDDVKIFHNRYGKPCLDDRFKGLQFSTSYSHNRVVFAAGLCNQLGVDIESIRHDYTLMNIAERFFYPEEWSYIRGLPDHEQYPEFFRLWTGKEAYVKMIGTGFSGWNTLPVPFLSRQEGQNNSMVFSLIENGCYVFSIVTGTCSLTLCVT